MPVRVCWNTLDAAVAHAGVQTKKAEWRASKTHTDSWLALDSPVPDSLGCSAVILTSEPDGERSRRLLLMETSARLLFNIDMTKLGTHFTSDSSVDRPQTIPNDVLGPYAQDVAALAKSGAFVKG